MKLFFWVCILVPSIIGGIASLISGPDTRDPDGGFYEVYDEEYEDW